MVEYEIYFLSQLNKAYVKFWRDVHFTCTFQMSVFIQKIELRVLLLTALFINLEGNQEVKILTFQSFSTHFSIKWLFYLKYFSICFLNEENLES